jgi:hypothetical protein
VSIAEQSKTMIVPFAAPEVRFGYRVSKKFILDLGVALFILLPPETIRSGKTTGDTFDPINKREGQRQVALHDVDNVRPGIMSLPREEGFGVTLALVPTIAAHFDF